jgi:hypothetical protein
MKDLAEPSNKPAATPETPAPAKAETPKAASLFDSEPQPVGTGEANTPVRFGTRPYNAESDADEDEEILRESCAEGEAEEGDEAA